MSSLPRQIRLVVFDWAGTTIDHGCFAPVAPFVQALARHQVQVTTTQARGPMGLNKKDHLRTLLQLPEVSRQWQQRHGHPWTEEDLEDVYGRHFIPLQMEAVRKHSQLVPGLLECVRHLRARQIKIGSTTGYFREAFDIVLAAAREQGYQPDHNLCAGDAPVGRPAPWMIFRIMEALSIYPPSVVVKVGDTVPDIQEGLNAGCWSIGVLRTSSAVGCAEEEWAAFPRQEQQAKLARAGKLLLDAGAHGVIESVAETPELIDALNDRLQQGQRP